MRQLTQFVRSVAIVAAAAVAAAMITFADDPAMAAPPNQPDPSSAARVELVTTKRDCDFNLVGGPAASTTAATSARTGQGSGFAMIGTTLNEVIAEVHLTNAAPNTVYNVRLIQLPSFTCGPSAPGVATGIIETDPAGNGTVDLQTDVVPGATGSWVAVLDGAGQAYTSNAVAPISTGR